MAEVDSPDVVADDNARLRWQIGCTLSFIVNKSAEVVVQVLAARSAGEIAGEDFRVELDGAESRGLREVPGPYGSRLMVFEAERGHLTVEYHAEIQAVDSNAPGLVDEISSAGSSPYQSLELEYARQLFLRPSRYCPSDRLIGFAAAEFGVDSDASSRATAITQWIQRRVEYMSGSSTVFDSAEDTLHSSRGTCRDFAHLGIALSRASGIPARFVAAYAPGLSLMDFHAVFETFEDGRWCLHDATGLAPRQSLVRIVTGRDAADAAFISFTNGTADCDRVEVSATVEPALLADGHLITVVLA